MSPDREKIAATAPVQDAADARERRRRIHGGGPFNAVVWMCSVDGTAPWIEKDFSQAAWIVRNTVGRFLVAREVWVLRKLGKTGAVPSGVRKISPFALREDVISGFALRDSLCGAYKGNSPDEVQFHGVPKEMLSERPPMKFFDDLATALRACHVLGFVHLDLHNSRNIMVTPGFRPVMLDWQSAIPTAFLPRPLRRILEKIDMAGVAKFRAKFHPEATTADERRRLHRALILRHLLWIPRVKLGRNRK